MSDNKPSNINDEDEVIEKIKNYISIFIKDMDSNKELNDLMSKNIFSNMGKIRETVEGMILNTDGSVSEKYADTLKDLETLSKEDINRVKSLPLSSLI